MFRHKMFQLGKSRLQNLLAVPSGHDSYLHIYSLDFFEPTVFRDLGGKELCTAVLCLEITWFAHPSFKHEHSMPSIYLWGSYTVEVLPKPEGRGDVRRTCLLDASRCVWNCSSLVCKQPFRIWQCHCIPNLWHTWTGNLSKPGGWTGTQIRRHRAER